MFLFLYKQASPWPEITWLKDNVPVMKRVTISNSDGSSQLLIPTSERLDSGIYSVLVKNIVGQETFSTEVRVTGKTIFSVSFGLCVGLQLYKENSVSR